MSEKREQIHYWNFLKTIAILMVVFCHRPFLKGSWLENYADIITYTAVPVFFMVNGAALFQSKFSLEKHLKKTGKLFLVTRVWRIIYLLFAIWYGTLNAGTLNVLTVFDYLLGTSIAGVPSGALWFIRALIACYVLFPVLKAAYDVENGKKYLLVICAVMMVCLFIPVEINIWGRVLYVKGLIGKDLILSFSILSSYNPIAIWGIFYFILGGLLHHQFFVEKRETSWKSIVKWLLVFLISSLWFFCIKGFLNGFDGNQFNNFGVFGVNTAYQSVAVIFMAVSSFRIAQNLKLSNEKANKFWKRIGRDTLPIYYMHYMLAYVYEKYIPFFADRANYSLLCNLLKVVLSVTICLLLGMVLKKIPVVRKLVE